MPHEPEYTVELVKSGLADLGKYSLQEKVQIFDAIQELRQRPADLGRIATMPFNHREWIFYVLHEDERIDCIHYKLDIDKRRLVIFGITRH